MPNYYLWAGLLVMALITYLPRLLSVTLFQKPLTSPFIRSFLTYVPYAALGSMTFPHIFYTTNNPWAALAGTVVALMSAWVSGHLLLVALLSVVATYAINLL